MATTEKENIEVSEEMKLEKEIAEILSIPENYTQAALLPVAWLKGNKLHKAKRLSLNEVAFWDNWGDW